MTLHYTFFKVTAEFYIPSSDEWDTEGYDVDYEYEVDTEDIYKALAEQAVREMPIGTFDKGSKQDKENYIKGYIAALKEYDVIDHIDEDDVAYLFEEEAEQAFKEEE